MVNLNHRPLKGRKNLSIKTSIQRLTAVTKSKFISKDIELIFSNKPPKKERDLKNQKRRSKKGLCQTLKKSAIPNQKKVKNPKRNFSFCGSFLPKNPERSFGSKSSSEKKLF